MVTEDAVKIPLRGKTSIREHGLLGHLFLKLSNRNIQPTKRSKDLLI